MGRLAPVLWTEKALARMLLPWKVFTTWVAAFCVVTAVGGVLRYGRPDQGLNVLGALAIAPVSLAVCGVSLAVLTWRFGWRGTAAFFMAAGFYDAGFDSLMGGIHQYGGTFRYDPLGLGLSTMLAVLGWFLAGRPQLRLDLSVLPVALAYFLLYPPPALHPYLRFDMGVVPGMFFYVWWQMRRDERERRVPA